MRPNSEFERGPNLASLEPEVDISVLIPFLNEERYLPESVPAMCAQEVDGEVEFIFIDARSTDRSLSILEAFAREDRRIRILDNPARATAAGLNVGLRAARGRYVARMDAHTYYPRQYLKKGVARLESGGVDWVTGPQIPHGDGKWSSRVALALTGWVGRGASDKWQGEEPFNERAGEEFELTTAVFTGVWRRETLDALGGWDEGWPVNQDSEMAARILANGGRIICRSDMGAQYVPRNTVAGLARQYRRYGFYRAKTFARHPASMSRARFVPVGVVLAFLCSFFPLQRLRGVSRAAAGLYLLGVAVASSRADSRGGRDPLGLAVVFVTMHLSWGLGFIVGLLRFLPQRRSLAAWPTPIDRPPAVSGSGSMPRCPK